MSTDLNLDTIAHLLRTEHGVANAYVEMTGGGVATIFAGPTREEADYGTRYAAVAGPGTFRYDGPSTGDLIEFAIGADDYGDTDPIDASDVGARTESDVARLIAAQARKADPTTPLSVDDVDALGFDGTGRSTAPDVAAEREATAVYCDAANAENAARIAAGAPYDAAFRARQSEVASAAVDAWKAARA